MIRLRRLLYIGIAFLLLMVKFTIDIISKNVEWDVGGVSFVRELSVLGAFFLLFLVVSSAFRRQDQFAIRRLGVFLIVTYAVLLVSIAVSLPSVQGYDRKNLSLIPLDYPSLFIGSFASIVFGLYAVLSMRMLNDFVLYRQRKVTRRNFLVLVGFVLATTLSVEMMRPLDSRIATSVLYGVSIVLFVVNSFRLPWIVYLTKREKVFTLVYSFFLFVGGVSLNIILAKDGIIRDGLLFYSSPLDKFVSLSVLFGTIYFGLAFISTLFHLPTADAFDRKRSEVTSLHTLSRLITQLFDFDELINTVTSMTLQVCEAKSCWLELVQEATGGAGPGDALSFRVVGLKNISPEDVQTLHTQEIPTLHGELFTRKTPIVLDDVTKDARFLPRGKQKSLFGSLVVMPLVSRNGFIGVLYATKESAYGFMKDDVDVISAFADQATIAIENARLINESLERERLIREMMLARDMQRKLLPQVLPTDPVFDIDAVSTPAFEVGGDYYDFIRLDDDHLGIIVGDVSGKGVPAAFYMSTVKGIFLSLSKLYPSPRDFLIHANEVLMGTADRHSFISLLFAVLNLRTGCLTLARAGHCPMLLVSDDRTEFVRPGGMGLGLSRDAVFGESLEEQVISLRPGDVCLFYTDGITEARCGEEEFGYERLLETAHRLRGLRALGIRSEILTVIDRFTNQESHDDDITLVVMKWKGAAHE